ncbi:hypothetical protein EYC80_004724 [Monilinia laxa]|uniref:Uncharacterized protein n=1 Tax=Monilinia laxa TaxID=61186 RepID=A0A5N6KHV0_MONLA|nr:hypothetical protein EYC80_004724 [Monilinia laxa]
MRSLLLPRSVVRSCRTIPTRPIIIRQPALVCYQKTIPLFQYSTTSTPTRRKSSKSKTAPSPSLPEEATSPLDQATSPATSRKTHYDLFAAAIPRGPPPSGPFRINLRSLHKEFLRLQAGAHPDLHPSDKSQAETASALINEAYKTLKSPVLRAQYLLELQGIDIYDETVDASVEEKEKDRLLLLEVYDASAEMEFAETDKEVDRIKSKNEKRIEECERTLGKVIDAGDMEKAKKETIRLKYWISLRKTLDEMDEKEEGNPSTSEGESHFRLRTRDVKSYRRRLSH